MPDKNLTITVTYTKNTPFHTVTVKYLYENGSQAAVQYTESIPEGVSYFVKSPEIEGYVANKLSVMGRMETVDVTETVTYAKKSGGGSGGGEDKPYNPFEPPDYGEWDGYNPFVNPGPGDWDGYNPFDKPQSGGSGGGYNPFEPPKYDEWDGYNPFINPYRTGKLTLFTPLWNPFLKRGLSYGLYRL